SHRGGRPVPDNRLAYHVVVRETDVPVDDAGDEAQVHTRIRPCIIDVAGGTVGIIVVDYDARRDDGRVPADEDVGTVAGKVGRACTSTERDVARNVVVLQELVVARIGIHVHVRAEGIEQDIVVEVHVAGCLILCVEIVSAGSAIAPRIVRNQAV